MTGFKFDSKKATDGDFAPIPEGKYECFIESGVVKTAATSGNKYVDFKLKVRDDVEGQAYGGRILWGKLHFTDASEGILHGFLKSINTPEGTDFGENYVEAIKDYAVGKAILADANIEVYKGESRNNVRYMNASKVGGGKIDDPFTAPVGSSPMDDPFATGTGPIEVSDDDLPF